MPGPASHAQPTTVLPQGLCTLFRVERDYASLTNPYPDGRRQTEILVTNSRRKWSIARKVSVAQLTALRDFYDARKGPAEAFWFYDPMEPAAGQAPGSNYDATGVSKQGRYAVHFVGPWVQSVAFGRAEIQIALKELSISAGTGTLNFSDPDNSGWLGVFG